MADETVTPVRTKVALHPEVIGALQAMAGTDGTSITEQLRRAVSERYLTHPARQVYGSAPTWTGQTGYGKVTRGERARARFMIAAIEVFLPLAYAAGAGRRVRLVAGWLDLGLSVVLSIAGWAAAVAVWGFIGYGLGRAVGLF